MPQMYFSSHKLVRCCEVTAADNRISGYHRQTGRAVIFFSRYDGAHLRWYSLGSSECLYQLEVMVIVVKLFTFGYYVSYTRPRMKVTVPTQTFSCWVHLGLTVSIIPGSFREIVRFKSAPFTQCNKTFFHTLYHGHFNQYVVHCKKGMIRP